MMLQQKRDIEEAWRLRGRSTQLATLGRHESPRQQRGDLVSPVKPTVADEIAFDL